jgi:glycosyltransferase involved in cell wall biosynthesis
MRDSCSRKLRVTMVAPAFPLETNTVNGGTAGVSLYLCRALHGSGLVDLDVVRPFAPPGMPNKIVVEGIPVHPLTRPASQFYHYHLFRGAGKEVTRKVRDLQPDVVHEQGRHFVTGNIFPWLVTIHGITEIDVLYCGNPLTRQLRSAILKATHGRARRNWHNVIAISPFTRRYLAANGNQRVWEIANPVDDSFFAVKRCPERGRIFSASHLQPLKNTHGLLRAFAATALNDPATRLRLAGSETDRDYAASCHTLAIDLGIAEKVDFLGVLNVSQIQTELAAAAVFASCSWQENAPLSIAEAMAVGVPVLGPAVGAVPWMVNEGVTGRLVHPLQANSVAEVLREMLRSPDLEAMGVAGKAKAARCYRASAVAQQTIAAYRELVGMSPS